MNMKEYLKDFGYDSDLYEKSTMLLMRYVKKIRLTSVRWSRFRGKRTVL